MALTPHKSRTCKKRSTDKRKKLIVSKLALYNIHYDLASIGIQGWVIPNYTNKNRRYMILYDATQVTHNLIFNTSATIC